MGSQDATMLLPESYPYYNPCGACRYLCRICTQYCVYAPHFPTENFSNVMQVLGGEPLFATCLSRLHASKRQYLIEMAQLASTMRQLLRQVEEALECNKE